MLKRLAELERAIDQIFADIDEELIDMEDTPENRYKVDLYSSLCGYIRMGAEGMQRITTNKFAKPIERVDWRKQ